MQRPTPNQHHRRLEILVGEWVGKEQIFPSPWDPKGGTADARVSTRLECGGFFVVTDYVEEQNGEESYRGIGVHGWDPTDRTYTLHWFDSMGGSYAAPARGVWDESGLTLTQKTGVGQSRYSYAFEPDRYLFRIETSKDGVEWRPFMAGTYTRVG